MSYSLVPQMLLAQRLQQQQGQQQPQYGMPMMNAAPAGMQTMQQPMNAVRPGGLPMQGAPQLVGPQSTGQAMQQLGQTLNGMPLQANPQQASQPGMQQAGQPGMQQGMNLQNLIQLMRGQQGGGQPGGGSMFG